MATKTKQALTLDTVTTLVTNIVSSAVKHMEERIMRRLSHDIRMGAYDTMTSPVMVNSPPIINTVDAPRMQPVKFSQLVPGTVFRLWNGSQPIVKLENPQHRMGWGAPAPHEANCYYLRTGSTNKIPLDKEVIPIKATITIDG